jgi:ABC-type transporter Mla subunit MlaD
MFKLFAQIAKNKKILTILIVFLIILGIYLYNKSDYVIIRFDELGPLSKNMSAYYNGFRIGKIIHIGPDKDFKHTIVKVILSHKNMNLPNNTTARVEKFPTGELYLQFIYPQSPSLKTIKRGDILEGMAPYSLEQFMMGQNISGITDVVSAYAVKALNATVLANHEIKSFFHTSSTLVQDNMNEISAVITNTKIMMQNFAQMAENLNQISAKLNNSIDETSLKNTTDNIKNTTDNIKNTSGNILNATKDIDKTVKKIDDTITQANAVAQNLNYITSGLNETLSKRFGGMRVMFGKPVKKKCVKNVCK